jgi:predicted RND superfamily exporter protein
LRLDAPADLFARFRPLVALFVIALCIAAGIGLRRLEFDDVPRDVFKTSGDEYHQLERFFADFESDDSDCLLVVQSPDLFTSQSIASLRAFVDQVGRVPGVQSVRSLVDVLVFDEGRPRSLLPAANAPPAAYALARQQALAHPLVRGQVLSEDGQTALVVARLNRDVASIAQIKPVAAELARLANAASSAHWSARLTGLPPIRVEIYEMVQRETTRFVLIGAGLAFLTGVALFRQIWAAVIVAAAPITASFWTLGLMGLVGERLNVINTVLPTLILVVGFADSMHLLMDVRHSLADGLSPLEASKNAIRHLFVACLLTAGTTAIGFAALCLAEVNIIRQFGIDAAAGCVLAFIATVTIVPLLASTRLGHRIRAAHDQDFVVKHFHYFERGLDWIVSHARSVTAAGMVVTLLLATSMWRLIPDNRVVEMIPRGNESYRALRHIDESLGGSLQIFVAVTWPDDRGLADQSVLDAIAAAQQALAETPGVHYPISVLDLLRSLPGDGDDLRLRVALLPLAPQDVTRRYVRPELRRALVTARLADIGSAATRPLYDQIDRRLAALAQEHPGMELKLTGTSVIGARSVHKMIESLNQSLLGAAVAIFAAIGVGFRSARLAAISVLPNIFPMVATATLLVLSGRPLQMTSVMVFSICLGIAVDDTIHFLNRFQREMEIDGDVRAAMKRAFRAVGSAVITTTVVLLVGFGSVLTSQMPPSFLFAWLSCVAYATAIIGDLVLLPALLVCFYPAGKPSERGRRVSDHQPERAPVHSRAATAASAAPLLAANSASLADDN